MSSRNIQLFLFTAAVSFALIEALRRHPCRENEFMKLHEECEPHCNDPKPEFCPYTRTTWCKCNPGFVRNSQDLCVKPEECIDDEVSEETGNEDNIPDDADGEVFKVYSKYDKYCGENQFYTHNVIMCEPSCEYPIPHRKCQVTLAEGCRCKPGYLRNSQRVCVKPDHCENNKLIMLV
ncbi:serine protease inhibitor swm-1-like [Microplitis mediator]|uniref:serine protease inhibitor swm-1-like n=1 Tax=Microplitis mediator TaxID=375433 RepID=UPI0025562C39|nr:serine protease inhibitor swm-1-like [Microplitis mediator]